MEAELSESEAALAGSAVVAAGSSLGSTGRTCFIIGSAAAPCCAWSCVGGKRRRRTRAGRAGLATYGTSRSVRPRLFAAGAGAWGPDRKRRSIGSAGQAHGFRIRRSILPKVKLGLLRMQSWSWILVPARWSLALAMVLIIAIPDKSRAQIDEADWSLYHLAVEYCRGPLQRPIASGPDRRIVCFDGWIDSEIGRASCRERV